MGGPYHVARPLIIPVRNILPCDHPGPTPKGTADITGLPPPSVRVAAPKDLSGRVQRGIYAQRGWITGACNFVLRAACNLALLKTRTPLAAVWRPTVGLACPTSTQIHFFLKWREMSQNGGVSCWNGPGSTRSARSNTRAFARRRGEYS